jgi:hypothetical protein
MILSSDELEIIEYLKSWSGKYVAMIEICRCAGGRQKFKESPHWAKNLMARLVEANMVEVNDRGHYRVPCETKSHTETFRKKHHPAAHPAPQHAKTAVIIGDDYFPASSNPDEAEPPKWLSPQFADILKKSGKKFSGPKRSGRVS